MKRNSTHVVITGPESSGKTTLWNQLKDSVDGCFVEEQARLYLNQHGLNYTQEDIKNIAYLQLQNQLEAAKSDCTLVISDTCLLTLIIWQEEKYGFPDSFTLEWFYLQKVDHYILLYPDIPWKFDPQRESEGKREYLFERYESWLKKLNIPYTVIKGNRDKAVEKSIEIIESI